MDQHSDRPALLPVVAIVGRPNVGKSTLFNCLTRSRDALVADEPGLTRDRQYGIARAATGTGAYIVVDTGGLTDAADSMAQAISAQVLRAVEESDAVIFMVDGRQGLTAADEDIASRLRSTGKAVTIAVNKTEGLDADIGVGEFHALGMAAPYPISAAHHRGIGTLVDAVLARIPPSPELPRDADEGVNVAIIGRPNVGKSTLINHLLGEDRLIAHAAPGTTRDSVRVPFRHGARRYTLVDTAGIRRRGRVSEKIEKFSVVKSLQAIAAADVVIVVLDAGEGVTDQDAGLLGMVLDAGRALTIAMNKWDNLDASDKRLARSNVERKLTFLEYVTVHYTSALQGTGLRRLFVSVDRAWRSASRKMSTPELNEVLAKALARNPPPVARGRRIKLRYAHQGGSSPPLIVIHGNQTDRVPNNYRRYLARAFREGLRLHGTPIQLEFKSGENPYEGRRNVITPRQQRRRKRLLKHAKRK
ncbi:MAG: ribosome biogenesis GTPase Der [Gammaproteobacteria bacterium]|nr:MAG: ribosome biogenesis GTPase Der [Gammaproteobacteria bacterium]